jgi:hypothetical protein
MIRIEHEHWVSCAECDFIAVEMSAGAAEEAAKTHLLTAKDHLLHIEMKIAVFNGCEECGGPVRFCEDDAPNMTPPGLVN